MSVRGIRSISDLDRGLQELKRFIKESGIGKQLQNRLLTTDAAHQFEITTTFPRRPGQRQPETETYVVHIPAGSVLYFLDRTAATADNPSRVNDSDFIVNDGSSSWRINTYTRTVQRRRHNFGAKMGHLESRSNAQE